jgi:hypothetical protein
LLNASGFISCITHSEFENRNTTLFSIFLFASSIISGPNHGPCVDVKQLASGALLAIALAPWKARFLATVHAPGNGARIPRRDQGQLAEDV